MYLRALEQGRQLRGVGGRWQQAEGNPGEMYARLVNMEAKGRGTDEIVRQPHCIWKLGPGYQTPHLFQDGALCLD